MAPPGKYKNIELKVGVFVALCLALFVLMLVTYGRFSPMWRSRTEISVLFENVSGLRPDAPVRYNGLEVGRVKWLRLVHLDATNLKRLPPLTKHDIENLPLRPDSLRKQLREVPDDDFDARCRQELKNRTMIELCLEVLQERDRRRFRVDDHVRIVSTVFGDTAIEIISGRGPIKQEKDDSILLGISGDFFSNLAKSMGEVKDILSSVTDVVGTRERESFVVAQSRLANINAKLDGVVSLAHKRAQASAKKMDKLSQDIPSTLSEAGKVFDSIRPKSQETIDSLRTNLKGMQERIQTARDESAKALDEIAADYASVRKDVDGMVEQSRPDFDQMRQMLRKFSEQTGGLSSQLQLLTSTFGRLMAQNEPDVFAMRRDFKAGLANLTQFGDAAKENKDLVYSRADKGEHEQATAVAAYKSLALASGRVEQACTELQEVCTLIAKDPQETNVLPRGAYVLKQLAEVRDTLAELREAVLDCFRPAGEARRGTAQPAKP